MYQSCKGYWDYGSGHQEGPVPAGQGVSGKAFCVSSETGQLNRDKGYIREGKGKVCHVEGTACTESQLSGGNGLKGAEVKWVKHFGCKKAKVWLYQ